MLLLPKINTSPHTKRQFLILCAIVAWLVPLAGCGSSERPFYAVSGKILFEKDDSPAQFGSIEFRSESKPIVVSRGKINKDGSFHLSSAGRAGTVLGSHTVVIQQVIGNPRLGNVVHNHGHEVARKYSDHRTTDLKVNIQEDSDNNLTLRVNSK